MVEEEGIGLLPRMEQEQPSNNKWKFTGISNIFPFEDCVSLIKHKERTLFKGVDFDTVEEANKLIDEGWFPVPF